MKKIFCLLLSLTLMLGLLSGCGAKEDVYIQLNPMDADLELAPNVIIEPDEPPYNLGGWMEEDDVWWYMELPRKDTYTVRFWYSMPSDYEETVGWLAILTEKDDILYEEPLFTPTSMTGGWEEYGYTEITMEMPKGFTTLSLMPYELPDGQDYFINLRSIEVFTGEGPAMIMDDEVPTEDPYNGGGHDDFEGSLSGVAGWWVRPEDFNPEGLSLIDCFLVDGEAGTWTDYNNYGSAGDTYSCWIEDDMLAMDLDALGPIYFLIDGDTLVAPETGEVEFVWTDDPGFLGSDLDYDGIWYRYGDPENPSYYVLEGDQYQKIQMTGDGPVVEDEGRFRLGTGMHGINDLMFPDVLKMSLDGDFAPDLYPCFDDNVLIEEESFDYAIYIRESESDPENVWLWTTMEELMNADIDGETSDGIQLHLGFEPFCFYISRFSGEGAGLESLQGTWSVLSDGYVELNYSNGDWLQFLMPQDDDDTIYLDYNGETVEMEITIW